MGIYYLNNVVIEAPGGDKLSRRTGIENRKICPTGHKMAANVSPSQRGATANYAGQQLLNRPYQSNFAFNRNGDTGKLNCSELVWLAFQRVANIDMDKDGGPGVYPKDILFSERVRIYENIA